MLRCPQFVHTLCILPTKDMLLLTLIEVKYGIPQEPISPHHSSLCPESDTHRGESAASRRHLPAEFVSIDIVQVIVAGLFRDVL